MITTRKPMVHCLPITKARANLGQVVKRAHVNKEYFILEKDGIPVAALLDIDELEDYLEMQDPNVRDAIQESNPISRPATFSVLATARFERDYGLLLKRQSRSGGALC